jgi:hypothetical protein
MIVAKAPLLQEHGPKAVPHSINMDGVEVTMYILAAYSALSFRNMKRRMYPTASNWSKGHSVHWGCMHAAPSSSGT